MSKKAKIEKVSRGEIKVNYDKKNQWELAERATQEEKELIVAEVEHFEKLPLKSYFAYQVIKIYFYVIIIGNDLIKMAIKT